MNKIYFVPFGFDFIEALKTHMLKDGASISRTALVFAGKRPALYLRRKLAEDFQQPFYPPQFFSIEEFIDHIARKASPDYIDLERGDAIWLLYQSMQAIDDFQDHALCKNGFGDFYYWGSYLLAFIDQLDTEHIPNDRLRSLEKNAEIGYDVPSSINELLRNISLLRDRFHEVLAETRSFTKGYKHLRAVEEIDKAHSADIEKVLFAGLFGLTGTERAVIGHMWHNNGAEIILDGDPSEWRIFASLVSDLDGEVEELPSLPGTKGPLPEIHIHSGFDTHSEVLKVHRILQDVSSPKTAVVLPASDPLFPLLTFAIDRIECNYNISLGYPLARTAVFDLIANLLNAQIAKRAGKIYPAPDYLSVVLHPFIKNLKGETELRAMLVLIERLLTGEAPYSALAGKPFITLQLVEKEIISMLDTDCAETESRNSLKMLKELHTVFFTNFEEARNLKGLSEALEEALQFILNHTPVRSFILSGEIFKALFALLGRTKGLAFSQECFHSKEEENQRIIANFMLHHLKTATLPFDTKPLEPVEIIGMLESRNISFDTVILLDVNEGIIPEPKNTDPLVPLGVYKTLGIPLPEYSEEIYRYHFYRLIRSAKTVHLLYIDSPERPRSRYIEQLLWEEEKHKRALDIMKIDRSAVRINLRPTGRAPAIGKTEEIMGILLSRIYSPSDIDDYIRCPVAFYQKHVLGLSERKTISEDIDHMERGIIIHRILQDTFSRLKDRLIDASHYDEVIGSLNEAIERNFADRIISGEYYLFKKLTEYKLSAFIKTHVREAPRPFVVKCLEEKIEQPLSLNGGLKVVIKGRIDRIDFYPDTGSYRVMDYKTGSIVRYRPGFLVKATLDTVENIHRHVETVQLPLYVYLFQNKSGVRLDDIEASLVLLRTNEEEALFSRNCPAKEVVQERYLAIVRTTFTSLLDVSKPFTWHNDDRCGLCEFRALCHV